MKKILVCGGAGFIGHHLARRLKDQGHFVVVADIKRNGNEFCENNTYCYHYIYCDLTQAQSWDYLYQTFKFDEIYQLAADMGGAGYIFTGEHDYAIMYNSAMINLHCAEYAQSWRARVFYSSSACMYPAYNQTDPNNPKCSEDSAYPAEPDSEYGWEKLFSERLYLAAQRNCNLQVKIARFHNIFGPEGCWNNGKEKAPAAICRKVKESDGTIEVWGDGEQTRSFLYIEDCLDAIQLLMQSDFNGPVNIGSEEMVSINQLVEMVSKVAVKKVKVIHDLSKPQGVRGRNSDNKLIQEKLGWSPRYRLQDGIEVTYKWIKEQESN